MRLLLDDMHESSSFGSFSSSLNSPFVDSRNDGTEGRLRAIFRLVIDILVYSPILLFQLMLCIKVELGGHSFALVALYVCLVRSYRLSYYEPPVASSYFIPIGARPAVFCVVCCDEVRQQSQKLSDSSYFCLLRDLRMSYLMSLQTYFVTLSLCPVILPNNL